MSNKKEKLTRQKKETDTLRIKDQSTSRLFIVVRQVKIHGISMLFIGWYGLFLLVET